MKKFEVKFSVFDKNLKVNVEAESEIDALAYVKGIIQIHSIISVQAEQKQQTNGPIPPKGGTVDDWQKYFNDLLGGFGKK